MNSVYWILTIQERLFEILSLYFLSLQKPMWKALLIPPVQRKKLLHRVDEKSGQCHLSRGQTGN